MKYPKPGPKPEKEKVPKWREKSNSSKSLTKAQRKRVFNRFKGACSYCGDEIDESSFHVDHKIPRRSFKNKNDAEFLDNLMPSCAQCNLRKGALSIERFRSELGRDIFQLKRDSAKFRLLIRYGLISVNDFPVVFYFEKLKKL